MDGVRPCPYCGGEVEVVKLPMYEDDRKKKFQPYRIQCYSCHALVAKGQRYPIETVAQGKERIKQYNNYIDRMWNTKRNRA